MKRILLLSTLVLYSLVLGTFVIAQAATNQPSAPHWVRVDDAYSVHQRWVVTQPDGTQTVLGELYQVQNGDVVGQCHNGPLLTFATVFYAQRYVKTCEVWQ